LEWQADDEADIYLRGVVTSIEPIAAKRGARGWKMLERSLVEFAPSIFNGEQVQVD